MSRTHTASCTECGWQSNPTRSEAQAAHAYRLHSCDRWRAKAEAAQRGREREASVDRTPKPCHHPRADHQHGTHACYVLDQCRCTPCSKANAAYESNRVRQTAYGRWNPYVSAAHTRAHVFDLMNQGMGAKTIAQRAGVSYSTLGRIIYGRGGTGARRFEPPSKKLRKETADAILAVTANVDTLADGAKIDGTGTRRRLQALVVLGWSQSQLADRMGYELRNFGYIIHGHRDVTARTARRARALYDELWDQAPPRSSRWERQAYTRSVNYAKARGWTPPLSWDEASIDDPAAMPDTGDDVRAHAAHRLHVDDVEFLLEHEPLATAQEIAERLAVGRTAVQHALKRAGRDDLLARLARNAEVAA